MDPRENDRQRSEQDLRPDPDEPGQGVERAAQPGASTPLESDQIVSSAPAKREQRERKVAEQQAEGGPLATGIGDDEP